MPKRSISIHPSEQTIKATYPLRQSGSSTVITIPAKMMQALDGYEHGTEIEITGNWETGTITLQLADGA